MLLPLRPEVDDAYRVPKSKVSVEVALRGQAPERVALFLSDRAAKHPGFERPSDVLYAEEAFLPVHAGDAELKLVRKGAIAWMSVPGAAEAHGRLDAEVHPEPDRCVAVEIALDDERTITGEVVVLLPDARRRVQDFLNASGAFFEVRAEGRFIFVNRDHVIAVKAME